MKGTKRKISCVIFFSKKKMQNYGIQKRKEKRKNNLTSKKRNKYQTNRNCHVARDNQIHICGVRISPYRC